MNPTEVEKFAKAYCNCFGGANVEQVKEVLSTFELSNSVGWDNVQIIDAWLLWNIAKSS